MKNDEKDTGSPRKGISAKDLLQKLKNDLSSHAEKRKAETEDAIFEFSDSDAEPEAKEEISEAEPSEADLELSGRRVYHVRRMSRAEWETSRKTDASALYSDESAQDEYDEGDGVSEEGEVDEENLQSIKDEFLNIEALMKKNRSEEKPFEADGEEIPESEPVSNGYDPTEEFDISELLPDTEQDSIEQDSMEYDSMEYDSTESDSTELTSEEEIPSEETESDENPIGDEGAEPGENGSEELDETDLNLMIAFGMEDELAKQVGQEKADEMTADADKKSEKLKQKEEQAEEVLANEYTSPAQNKAFFNAYKKQYQNCLIRLFLCAALLILTFFYENIGLFHATLPGALNPVSYPVVYIMIDLQLLVLGAALVWRQIRDGALAMLRLKPIPESVHAVLLLLTLLYHVALCFFPVGASLRLFNFPMMLCLLMALIHELLNLRREILTFNVIAAKRLKYALDRLDPDKAPLETEAFYDVLPDRPSIFKITKAAFVDDFKRRMGGYSHNKVALSAMIPLAVLIAAVLLILSLYRTGSFSDALTSAYTALMLAMPFSVFLTYSLPFYKASRVAFETESAIIGDVALDEYASASSVSFDDRDVFPSYGVKVKSVKVFGASRIDEIIYFAASVFNLAGGPLRDVFDVATMDLGHSEDVELLSISPNGLEALVDGEQIVFCKESYLLAGGYSITEDPEDAEVEQNGEISIMYFVRDGEVSAKLYVQYHLDSDFEFILKKLHKAGTCVGIKTLDPNIDDEMLARYMNLDRFPVRVLKCHEIRQTPDRSEHVSSGIVSRHSPKAMLQAFALCDKVQHITKTNLIVNAFAIIISVLISAFIVIFGLSGGVYSLYVALYQVFWMIPMLVMTRLFL